MKTSRPLFLRLLLSSAGCFFLSCGTPAESLPARPSATELATRELLKSARMHLEDGRSGEAVPYLREVVRRFSELKTPEAAEARATGLYQLGLCLLETRRFSQAAETFQQFVREYPGHESAVTARFLTLEALARRNDPAAVRACAERLESSGALDAVLEALSGEEADFYRHAMISLVSVYARAADTDRLNRFLPYCDETARGDAGLNVALMQGADSAVQNGRYLQALFLYRQVRSSRELLESCDRRLEELKARLDVPLPWVPLRQRDAQAAERAAEQARFERLQTERRMLAEKNYDADLMMRFARCYEAMDRCRVSACLYNDVYSRFPTAPQADSARYAELRSLMTLSRWPAARSAARNYLDRCPQGRYRDEVSLCRMQCALKMEDFVAADELGRALLAQEPVHRYLDQGYYLMGFLRVREQQYDAALPFFVHTAETWPERLYAEEAFYWIGMCHLFAGRFDPALETFNRYLTDSRWQPKAFIEDVSFQIGMARYGKQEMDAAHSTFTAFLKTFPDSPLAADACSMLGDLHGADGELERALEWYEKARERAVRPEQIDYAVFRSAESLRLLKRHRELADFMEAYLTEPRAPESAVRAVHCLAAAWQALGRTERALDRLCGAVCTYGNDPQTAGIESLMDMLMSGEFDRERIKTQLEPVRTAALQSQDRRALGLRLTTLLAGLSSGAERVAYIEELLTEPTLTPFSPVPLLLFATEAAARGDAEKVRRSHRHFMETFDAESDRGLEITLVFIDVLIRTDETDEALALVEESLERYAALDGVGRLQKRKGDLLRLSGQYAAAVEAYREFLSRRSWRGPLTPEVLYWTGICAEKQGRIKEAAAYFQRVYILYEPYTDWVARAYEASSRCLLALGRRGDAVQTWREMLSSPDRAATPEGRRAAEALRQTEQEIAR